MRVKIVLYTKLAMFIGMEVSFKMLSDVTLLWTKKLNARFIDP